MTDAPRLLLVDDHVLIREMLEEKLISEDFEVVTTGDTARALELAIELRSDVVVLDIDMPGLSTFEVARVLRSESPETRVVFLSAYVRDDYIEQALAVEAAGYLCKCEPLDDICAAIKSAAAGSVCYSRGILNRIVVDGSRARLAELPDTKPSLATSHDHDVTLHVAEGHSERGVRLPGLTSARSSPSRIRRSSPRWRRP